MSVVYLDGLRFCVLSRTFKIPTKQTHTVHYMACYGISQFTLETTI